MLSGTISRRGFNAISFGIVLSLPGPFFVEKGMVRGMAYKLQHKGFFGGPHMTREEMREKVARSICCVNGECYRPEHCYSFTFNGEADAAIAIIRGETLEEAARVAEATTAYDDNLQRSAGCGTTGQRIAAAIRAMKDQATT